MTDVARPVAVMPPVIGDAANSNRMARGDRSTVVATVEDDLALGPEQSHRIISVLEDAAEKLGFLGSIMPDVLQHRDELSKFVGDEISRIIQVWSGIESVFRRIVKCFCSPSLYCCASVQVLEVTDCNFSSFCGIYTTYKGHLYGLYLGAIFLGVQI